jgi:cell division cycle protein 37
MLSLEEQIIDATTEEGQAALKEFEEQERVAQKKSQVIPGKYSEDPE